MPTDLDKLLGIIPGLRGNALSAQTNRSLIEHGEHVSCLIKYIMREYKTTISD